MTISLVDRLALILRVPPLHQSLSDRFTLCFEIVSCIFLALGLNLLAKEVRSGNSTHDYRDLIPVRASGGSWSYLINRSNPIHMHRNLRTVFYCSGLSGHRQIWTAVEGSGILQDKAKLPQMPSCILYERTPELGFEPRSPPRQGSMLSHYTIQAMFCILRR